MAGDAAAPRLKAKAGQAIAPAGGERNCDDKTGPSGRRLKDSAWSRKVDTGFREKTMHKQ
jgi:hypothetical protein